MPDAPLDLLVSHPGNPRVYDMVAALAQAGLRLRFATGLYGEAAGPFARAAAFAPPLRRALMRRHHPDIPPEVADASWVGEALRHLPPGLNLYNRWFDRRAARLVRRLRPRAAICADTTALRTFRAAQEAGAWRILDQVTGFVGAAREMLLAEASRRPETADSIAVASEETVARCRAEALAADLVLSPSDYVRDTLIEIGVAPERIARVPYGVDTARFRPAAAPRADGPLRVLYVGRIGAPKGVHYLLEAFRRAALPDAELVLAGPIVGKGDWLASYRGMYRHVPEMPHREAHALYAGADVFVFPTLHDGFGVVILEAMASGIPVILTTNAADIVRDGVDGFVVPVRDPDAIADRMRRLHADGALRRRMGENARARAEEHDLARYRRNLAAAIGALLARGRPGGSA